MTLSFTSPLSTRTWSFPLPYFLNTALWSFWWDQFQCLHYLDDIHVITAGPYRQYESLSFPFVSFSVLFIFVFTANSSSNLSLNCLLGEGLKHHLVGDRCQSTTLVFQTGAVVSHAWTLQIGPHVSRFPCLAHFRGIPLPTASWEREFGR